MLILAATTCAAQQKPIGDFAINIWGNVRHLGPPPQNQSFTETNLSLGIRWYFPKTKSGAEIFADTNFFHNATSGSTVAASVGYQKKSFTFSRIDVLWGAALGAERYENRGEKKIYITPGAYLFIGFRHGRFTTTIGYLPTTPGVLYTYTSIRF